MAFSLIESESCVNLKARENTRGIGWRKLGDDGQELGRMLELVLDGVRVLKTAVRRGQRLDGEGEKMFNSKEMWCPELCRCVVNTCYWDPSFAYNLATQGRLRVGRRTSRTRKLH